jgi:hypothetical protein
LSAALDWITNFFDRAGEAAGAIVAPPDVPDDRPIQINAPAASSAAPAPPHADVEADVEAEDASLLDPPEVSGLPVTTPEARQAKRRLVIEGMKAARSHFTVRPYPEPAPVPSSLPHDEDDVSSELNLRLGITSQLGGYVLRYPAAIARLRANGFRPEYFGCDHAFFADLFEIAQMPEDHWNRRLAELKLKHSAEYSKYLRLGEHLPALSSDELAEYFIPLAGIIQPNPAPVEIDIEPINSHTILEQEPPAAPLQSSPIEIDEQSPAALPAIVEQQPPEPAGEERAPALQHDFVGHTVTPEHRLIGLIVKHRVPAADVQLKPKHFHDPDLRYTWKRWERLGSDVDQLDEGAIRARTESSRWAVFAIWLIEVAAASSDPDNPTDPKAEIATLAEQIRGREPPPAATDVVEILPPVPAAAPPETRSACAHCGVRIRMPFPVLRSAALGSLLSMLTDTVGQMALRHLTLWWRSTEAFRSDR